jgi:hypothetical protein
MALILSDRVQETTTTAGTGTITLAGAVTGYQSFAVRGNGNTTYYCIAGLGTNEWEVGIGTYSSAGTTLARTTILASSNGGSVVTFSAGSKSVFVTYPAEKSVNLDASGNASALGTPVSFVGTNITGTAAGLTAGAATALATARTIAGVSFNGSANIDIPLDGLSDVIIDTPLVNQLLGYNGTNWINTNAASAGAGSGVVFYNATPVISASGTQNNVRIATLATVPVVTAEQTVTGDSNNNTVLFSCFVSAALGRTVIDAGIWDFTNWVGVSSTTGSNLLTRQVYTAIPFLNTYTVTMTGTGTTRTATASGGTPFATGVIDASATNTTASYLQTPAGLYQITARTSDTVVTINNVPTTYTNEVAVAGKVLKKLFGITTTEINSTTPDYGLYEVTTTAGAYAITAATGIGILGFFTCGNTHTITVPYNGTTHNTHVSSPLANLHNDLAGLNGGVATEYYHSTLAEYTGTGTGVFVRATSAVLTSPNLDTPTALVGTNITGTAAGLTAGTVTTNANLTGEATSVGNAATLTNSAVIGKVLTGYTSGAGTVAATDTILQAIQKLDGNTAAVPGTVTSVSVVTNNGFAGTVATSTSTPAITLTTTVTGMLKGSSVSGIVSAGTSGTDYSLGTSALATGILKSTTTTGALTIAVAATDYVAPSAYASANGLTMATARLLGRSTSATGAAEEITVGTGLSLATGTLTATATSASLSNDTTSSSYIYPVFATGTTGVIANLYTSNAKLLYKPSTGELAVTAPIASNGLVLNANTVATSYTIAAGYNASSVGPITVSGGVVVTITAGQRWVVL